MSIDWKKSMQRTYEFYEVDPGTWKNKRKLSYIKSCNVNRDLDAETLGNATIDCDTNVKESTITTDAESEKLSGEFYVRAYMTPVQNGVRYVEPLATYMVQTPKEKFDGKVKSISLDAYSPLMELKDTSPPLGFTVRKGSNIMETAARLCREHMRAPVISPSGDLSKPLFSDFTANTDDTWFSYLTDLISNANFEFDVNELGEVLFAPVQDTASLQPVYTYDDSNSSILYPDISVERDLYGIPNVVEVVLSSEKGCQFVRVVNDDPNSPISTVNRGREVLYRDTNPSIYGTPTDEMLEEYARKTLRNLSTLEYKISYKHGYTPVRIGSCVRLNYELAGIRDVKAKVISQSFSCDTECSVTETAIYTNKLWG